MDDAIARRCIECEATHKVVERIDPLEAKRETYRLYIQFTVIEGGRLA
jgi:hypothetical protein